MIKPSQIIIVTITVLLMITISATYYAAGPRRTPTYDSVFFFKQEYASTSFGGVAMKVPFNNLSSVLEPLPTSFEISRRWSGVYDWADHGVSLWTIMKRGEVIQYGFNSSHPVVMALISGQNYIRIFHTNSSSSYYGTFIAIEDGLYFFDFSIDDSVEHSVNSTISFRCLEARNRAAIDTPWFTNRGSIKPVTLVTG